MKRVFTASVSKEGHWYVAQALEADVASQGESVDDALTNLREALELHFEPPFPRQSLNSSASRYRLPPVRPQPYREGRLQAHGRRFRRNHSEGSHVKFIKENDEGVSR